MLYVALDSSLEVAENFGNFLLKQEISPGCVETEIQVASGYAKAGENWLKEKDFPALKDSDVSQSVLFLLMTPYSVNITEIVIKPTGENY